jgi:hypothetical protein
MEPAALNQRVIGLVLGEPIAHQHCVDAFLGAGANHRDVEHGDELGRGVDIELDEGEGTMDAGIDSEQLHDSPPA